MTMAAQSIQSCRGWQAELSLGFAWRGDKTALVKTKHLGPLRVQRPFYPEADVCHVYMLHPPGGVVGSDSLTINIECGEQSHALITTPGATKFYRSAGDTALVKQALNLKPNSILEWFPQENIFFPGAKATLTTEVNLSNNAVFMGWEINCLGRPANSEIFDPGTMDSRLVVKLDNKAILVERQRVLQKQDLFAAAGLRGYPMNALFLASGCAQEHVDAARKVVSELDKIIPIGITLIENLLVLRALGHSTEQLQSAIIPVWKTLRPQLINKAPITPRIWLT